MTWKVIYHPGVRQDLAQLGSAAAKRVLDVIEERIRDGEPEKLGKPLRGTLAGCRRIRTGNTRIVYRVDGNAVQVLIIAVGARRDEEAYKLADQERKRGQPPFTSYWTPRHARATLSLEQ
ncbi:type II toxin-antitoxin system RelE family toxin [Ectothiorhodospira marina]|uniref:mRNA interferase RelE/StbE n=1 Tax=Ectothiorhodospira marina TaxID=1396821 RepID=A0A1H7RIV8_9GAMM|nr:mRNA interferase RelE/StbE [Ectothiorhodospira marina]